MHKTKRLSAIFSLMLLAALVFNACSSTKEVTEEKEVKTAVDNQTERSFKQSFFEGQQAKMSGNFETAGKHFRKCTEVIPSEPAPYYELARIYDQQDQLDRSLRMLEKAVELDSDNIWYQSFYAKVNAQLGKYDVAIE